MSQNNYIFGLNKDNEVRKENSMLLLKTIVILKFCLVIRVSSFASLRMSVLYGG